MNDGVIECGINFLSYERALSIVPPEFIVGYEWFQSREGDVFQRLPHRDSSLILPDEIRVCADRGIHGPDYKKLASKGAGKREYALTIHSHNKETSNHEAYDDKDVVFRNDGTWILDYCGHKPGMGKKQTESGNKRLMNNLADGVPVAVLVQQADGSYRNFGLAYVERYDSFNHVFTLHGPVSAETENIDFCSIVPYDQLTPDERQILKDADAGDQRKRVMAEQIRRERQGVFRKIIMDAYGGQCAATGVNVPEVLQAAHIDPYRGKQSQVATNGMLLRSDIHLLYDSHLMTVEPESNRIVVSKRLQSTLYEQLDGKLISVPKDSCLRPNDELLEMHMREFGTIEKLIA